MAHTHDLWEQLRGESVFITGGTGFFGRWLLESFAEANRKYALGARIVALSRDPEAFQRKAPHLASDRAFHFVRGDIVNVNRVTILKELGSLCPDRFAYIIHGASETSLASNSENPVKVLQASLNGTRQILDFAIDSGALGFLLLSSGAVYGELPKNVTHVSETYIGGPDVSAPLSAYGEGKRVAELLCSHYGRTNKLSCKIARCFAFVGPYLALDAHYAIGNFIRDALEGRAICLSSNGSAVRSYMYAADLAIWLWTILLQKSAVGTYNVGSDQEISILEVAEHVALNGSTHRLPVVARTTETGIPVHRYVPDTSRARRDLGLSVRIPLDAAIQRTVKFHQNPDNSRE